MIHPTRVQRAFVEGASETLVGVVLSLDGYELRVGGIDRRSYRFPVKDAEALSEALARDDLTRMDGLPCVLVSRAYELVALAHGPAEPPERVVVSGGVRTHGGSAVEMVASEPQPQWLLFELERRQRPPEGTSKGGPQADLVLALDRRLTPEFSGDVRQALELALRECLDWARIRRRGDPTGGRPLDNEEIADILDFLPEDLRHIACADPPEDAPFVTTDSLSEDELIQLLNAVLGPSLFVAQNDLLDQPEQHTLRYDVNGKVFFCRLDPYGDCTLFYVSDVDDRESLASAEDAEDLFWNDDSWVGC